jgi:hypothetical protein
MGWSDAYVSFRKPCGFQSNPTINPINMMDKSVMIKLAPIPKGNRDSEYFLCIRILMRVHLVFSQDGVQDFRHTPETWEAGLFQKLILLEGFLSFFGQQITPVQQPAANISAVFPGKPVQEFPGLHIGQIHSRTIFFASPAMP